MSVRAASADNNNLLDQVFSKVDLPKVDVDNKSDHDKVIDELDRILARDDSAYMDNVIEQHLLSEDHQCSRRNSQLSTKTRSRQPSILEETLHNVNSHGIVNTILSEDNLEAREEEFGAFPVDALTEPHANVLSYVTSHEPRKRTETVDSYASEAESRFGSYDLNEREIDLNHPHIAYGNHEHLDVNDHEQLHDLVSTGIGLADLQHQIDEQYDEDIFNDIDNGEDIFDDIDHGDDHYHEHTHVNNHNGHVYDKVPEENIYEEIKNVDINHNYQLSTPISEDTYDRINGNKVNIYDGVYEKTNDNVVNKSAYSIGHISNGNPHQSNGQNGYRVTVNDNDYLVSRKSKVGIKEEATELSRILTYQIKNAEKIGVHGPYTYYRPYFTLKNHEHFPEITVGGPTDVSEERVLLLVGESKTGKTSFIYSLLNYLYDVQKEHNFRLAMELPGKFENINERCITYKFANTIYPFTVTVIDTPGIELNSTPKLISRFIKHKLDRDSKLRLDALVPVVKASHEKVNKQVLNHYRHIQYLFGDDLRTNLLPVVTFAKGPHRSLDLTSLWSLKLPFSSYYIVNNLGFLPNDGTVTGLNHSVLFKHGVVNLEAFFEVLDTNTIPLLLAKSQR